jgi:endonuclease/exonuclease/phosphatase (EEP) superfamily protein YafD
MALAADDAVLFDPALDRRARLWGLADVCGGLVLAPLALAALIRLIGGESTVEAIALRAFTAWVYLPSWLVLALAALRRRYRLIAPAALLAALHLYWLAPSLAGTQPEAAPGSVAERFRVMSANVLGVNGDTPPLTEEILRERPDLLLVQEVTDAWSAALTSPAMQQAFPKRRVVARDDSFGIGVFSRFPLEVEELWFEELPAQLITVHVGARELHVLHAHTLPPRLPGMVGEWHRMMDAIEQRVRTIPPPLLLAGDLNTTQFSERYARLLSLGLRGTHEDRGEGLATTWPNGRFPFPPIRLDHFLITDDITAFTIHEGEGHGSDHRPIVAELGLLKR